MNRFLILGETTYDIIFKENKPVDARVGGSQLNTSISLGRLGLPVEFISHFGRDQVGVLAEKFLVENGISTSSIARYDGNSRIALAFLDQHGNASYSFYQPANENIVLALPQPAADDLVLFGSSFALNRQLRPQLVQFLNEARQNGALVMYDPNFRPSMISRMDELKPLFDENISLAHLVKGSDEDFSHLMGTTNIDKISANLQKLGCSVAIITANKRAVEVMSPAFRGTFPVSAIAPVSTIGAGDTFNAGILYQLYCQRATPATLNNLRAADWKKICSSATQMAQHVCMHYDNYITREFANKMVQGRI